MSLGSLTPIVHTYCKYEWPSSWDERKNASNARKHGVSFEEAKTAFYDENAKIYDDPDHSFGEDRFILLGISIRIRLVVVCHSYRGGESPIRIISARKANRREREAYLQ
jgi:uncharacterized DUF497 family protein